MMRGAWTVYLKELRDALRDRRTLAIVLLSSVAMGPLVLVALSALVGDIERQVQARVIVVHGLEHAPALRNWFERQTYTARDAPADYERLLQDGKLGEPVLVVPPSFEADVARGVAPLLEVVSSGGNQRARMGTGTLLSLLNGYNQEQRMLRLAVRGVAPGALEALRVEERELADAASRGGQFALLLPFFVLMAMLYGALHAALDTTAGERERGSLEPLLMNPAPRGALVLGKWGAVASVALLIGVLSCLSFLPGQWLLRSEALAVEFRFGPREALAFVGLLLPLAAALSALLMALAIRCRTFKEAQANSAVLLLAVSLLPMVSMFNREGTAPWHLWTPALAQTTLMSRVLKGEVLAWLDVLPGVVVCAVLGLLALAYVTHMLRGGALK